MKKLLKSTTLALHCHPMDDLVAYVKAGLQFHKEAGFDVADISLHNVNMTNGPWQEMVAEILTESERLDLPFKICHLPFFGAEILTDREAAEAAEKWLVASVDVAKALGVEYAVVHPNCTSVTLKSYDKTKHYDRAMAHLTPVAERAAQVGLNLVVENTRLVPGIRQSHRYCQTPDELCELADALGIGICWDFGHANLAGLKQSEALAYIGKRLKVLHVNDNNGADDDHVAPFMGNVNWVDAMHGLALAEFDGCLNYEVNAGRIPAQLRMDFAKYLVDAADQLMEYIV